MVDLTAKEEVRPSVDLTAKGLSPAVTDKTILDQRVAKYEFALGEDRPDTETLTKIVASGNETDLRTSASYKDMLTRSTLAQNMLPDAIRSVSGGSVGDPEYIAALASVAPVDPSIVLESKYAENAVNTLQSLSTDQAQQEEEAANPGTAEILYQASQQLTTNKQIALKLSEDYNQKVSGMGWGPYLGYTALSWTPLQWANIASHGREFNLEFTGQAIIGQVQKLYKLPPAEFKRQAEEEMNRLAETNPLDAQKFADALVSYGASDADIDNFFNIVDVATSGTVANLAKGATKLPKTVARMKQITKAANQKVATIPDVLANAGHTEDAAEAAAREAVARAAAPKDAPDVTIAQVDDMLKQTPSLYNAKYHATDMGPLPLTYTERLIALSENNLKKLNSAVHVLRPATLTSEALEAAFDTSLAEYKKLFPKLSDNIMSVQRVLPEQTETNTGKMIVQWGKDGGKSAYTTWSGALQGARKRYRFKEFQIKELGPDNFVIETNIDVGEGRPEVFSGLMTTENSSGPASAWSYVKSVMGAKEQVSKFQAEQRAATTHGVTHLGEIVASVVRPTLEKLTKQQFKDLDKIMAVNRDSYRVPGDPDTRGMFYTNPSELNQAYLQHVGRPVTENEADAYFTQVQLSDFDWKVRSLNAARDKIRKGAMTHEVRLPNVKTGKDEALDIEATKIDKLPANSRDDANVLVYVEGEAPTVVRLSTLAKEVPEAKLDAVLSKKQAGYIALRVYDPSKRDINDLLNYKEPIHYVVVKSSRPAPLNLSKQLPYRPGFHVEYNNNWYIKMPKFGFNKGRRAHLGDTTLLGIQTEKEGRALLKTLAEAQRLYKSKDNSLESYLTKNTPFTVDEFKEIMENFSDDIPFVLARDGRTSVDSSSVTSSGKTIRDLYGEFDNLINSPHNDALSANMEFMGEKDPMLKKAVRQGTDRDPIWKLEDADMVSPLATQTRAMGRLIRSVGYEDYQIGAVNSYISEFGSALKYKGQSVSSEQLQRNPMFYFKHSSIEHPDQSYKWQAGQIKQRIEDLVGQPSQFALSMEDFRSKLAEGALGDWVPEKTIPFIKDPARYARAMVSHMKLGMFNPVQFFLQQATHFNIAFISPLHGASQIPATILMRFAAKSEDEAIWDYYASLVEKTYHSGDRSVKFAWDAKKFRESLEGYQRSGFGIIGGEYAWRNDISDPKLFRGNVGKFLDKGYLFFNHAEQNVRMAAWNTSYSEYLASSGKSAGSLKDADFRKILVRAQDLSGNMSRDASAFWQKGLLGSTTQYYAYTARILELLVGKRLSLAEKARLGGGLSLLYGFPVLAGATYLAQTGDWEGAVTAINPFDEDLRTYALENGIPIDDTALGAINNGLASAALHLVTGQHFDVASRYSPFGADLTSNLTRNMDQHNPTLAILITALGASGSIIRDMLQATYPIARDAYQMIGEGDTSQLVLDDFFNATREISSLNAAEKILAAWNGWQYLSKKGTLISKNDDEVASLKILEAVTGLQTYGETDVFRQITAMRKNSKAQEQIKKEITKYANYYIQALQSGNEDGRRQYMNRIEAYMQLLDNQSDRNRLWGTIFSQPELRDAVSKSFSKRGSEEQRINREKQRISQ